MEVQLAEFVTKEIFMDFLILPFQVPSWCLQHACLSTPETRLEQIDLRVW
jgi:hypothetical protein